MGRKPIIKPAILLALNETDNPLRFSELQKHISNTLNREKLDGKQLNHNLTQLVADGVVEKILFKEKIAYKLTTSYYEQQLKATVLKLLSETNTSHFVDSLQDEELPPYLIFLNPPAYNYENNAPIEKIQRVDVDMSFGGGPMEKIGESRIIPSWEDPSNAISSIMLNDFYGLFSYIERKNTIELIKWAYWVGVRKTLEDTTLFSWSEAIEENIKHAQKCINKFKDNYRRVEAEKTLINILEITEGVLSIKNLAELISYINEKKDEHRLLLNKIMITEGLMAGGERLFLKFLEYGRMVVYGLVTAGILRGSSIEHRIDYKENTMFTSSKVWDDFFIHLIQGPVYIPELYQNGLLEIKGNLSESLESIKEYGKNINNLLELPFKRKISLVYFWGYPELFYLANKGIIRTFKEWRDALLEGRLNHRLWLFEEKTLQRLRRAYNSVRRNKEPLPIRIDKEPWNLRDLYNYHPYGNDPSFWDGIIRDIEKIALKREEFVSDIMPNDFYGVFINKEKEVWSKAFDEEEQKAENMRKKR